MAAVVKGGVAEVRDAEVLIGRPDGTQVSVVVNIRVLKNEQGQVTGAINCFYDVTERKAGGGNAMAHGGNGCHKPEAGTGNRTAGEGGESAETQ